MGGILREEFLQKYKHAEVPWGFNGLGYIVYKRTYARLKEDGTTEEWWETIRRCIEGAQEIGAEYTPEEAEELFDHLFNLRCNFAGRMLWQLGTPAISRFGGNSMLNCWFVAIKKYTDFCFIFENLMLGGGVGFSVRREDVMELPRIKSGVVITQNTDRDATFIVPDSREGWVELLRKVFEAYYDTGKGFSYSTLLVRGKGEPIKTFGGTASGPSILVDGVTKICEILESRAGKKLRSLDVLDICNIIGSIVVAGNVRRSAEIACGDPDDFLFLRAKRWDLGNIPNWRSMSNNTIYADSYEHIAEEVWKGYIGNGEPYGFFNLPLAQKYGRIGERRRDNCEGLNPCGEVTLASHECCDLGEIYLPRVRNKAEMIRISRLLYKTMKAVLGLNFIHEETNAIVHKNMRLGLSVTGICEDRSKIEWLDETYRRLRDFDKEWSAYKGWNESIKLTTVKPSGTLSLLAGVTPGVHPAFDKYYIRRVRLSSSDDLVDVCKEMGYHVEFVRNFDGSDDHSTVVVEFPCCSSESAILATEMTAVEQLDLVKTVQKEWADNAVSVTVYYNKNDITDIRGWLKQNYDRCIKSVSFLPHNEHGFDQAPYESIDEATYIKMIERVKPISEIIQVNGGDSIDGLECSTGACPVK